MLMTSDQELYNELAYYTLSHRDPAFIHQHIVDAYAAKHMDEHTKPIGITFALIGLYLYVEKNFTGRQVQKIHMQLAKRRKQWPRFAPPQKPGVITVSDVVAAPPGKERDEIIREWCVSVWETWKESRDQAVNLARKELNMNP